MTDRKTRRRQLGARIMAVVLAGVLILSAFLMAIIK
jgi:hypothetical protein